MPFKKNQPFRTPGWLPGGDLQTMVPGLFRKVARKSFESYEIPTPDGDVLELDFYSLENSTEFVILCHGLEGDSRRPYMLGMTEAMLAAGKQVVAWNYRGCGSKLNQKPIFYHSGATYDLETVVKWVQDRGASHIFLIGFSLGGNLVMKYLGEKEGAAQQHIFAAAAISVPTDLDAGCTHLDRALAWPYRSRFLKTLRAKVLAKAAIFPGAFAVEKLPAMKKIRDFDNWFTAPLHGFADAADYYRQNSSCYFIPAIKRPVLLLQALNDPFLAPACYPINLCKNHAFVTLELSDEGGHVGFPVAGCHRNWPETRVPDFFRVCE